MTNLNLSPISFSLPYQERTIVVDNVSQLMQLRWGEFDMGQAAREIDAFFKNDLSSRVNLIRNTLTTHLPQANEQNKNILIACLKTALLSSLIAGTIFTGLFLGSGVSILLGVVACIISITFYIYAAEEFIFPERRIQEGEPTGPWFAPNVNTTRGAIAAGSIVWPILSGLFLPLTEACTRKSRWENVIAEQNKQLANIIPSCCNFYKQHGQALIEKINASIQSSQDEQPRRRWEQALESLHSQIVFLKNFDPSIPDLL